MSILYLAHGHPRFAHGGGELAAYRLFEAISQQQGFHQSGLLCAVPNPSQLPPGCQITSLHPNQWLIARSSNFLLHDSSVNLTKGPHGAVYKALCSNPFKLIHAHHYVHIGLDLLIALKDWFPQAPLVLTLHEYWGMCAFEGRLLRRDGRFCDGPSPRDCLDCLGDEHRLALTVRRLRIRHLFSKVDSFISPSQFLKDRYVDWGLEASRIAVIENLPCDSLTSLDSPPASSDSITEKQGVIFAYFGQLNPWKGIDKILEAFVLIQTKYSSARLHLNGLSREMLAADASHLSHDFRQRCLDLLDQASEGSVVLRGSYHSQDLSSRFADVDVVVMASRWYENAPMVIQESFSHGVPVIAPRLGGMAEKIQHQSNGYLYDFAAFNGLHDAFQWFLLNPDLIGTMKESARASALRSEDVLAAHLNLYQSLMQA